MSNEAHEPELVITAPTAWKVLDIAQNEPTLVSYGSFIWRHGKTLQSVCNRVPEEDPCEPGKPKEDCTCGIYCCDTATHPEIMVRIRSHHPSSSGTLRFLVKLQLHGRVIVCQTGFRAGAAKLTEIHVIYFDEAPLDLAADLEATYQVPVFLEWYQKTPYYDPRKEVFGTDAPPQRQQPAPPMYLSDYVKLFYTLDSGRKAPEDLQVTFVREYMKKLTKETKKTSNQLTALTQHSAELNRWMTDLKGFIASIRKKP